MPNPIRREKKRASFNLKREGDYPRTQEGEKEKEGRERDSPCALKGKA